MRCFHTGDIGELAFSDYFRSFTALLSFLLSAGRFHQKHDIFPLFEILIVPAFTKYNLHQKLQQWSFNFYFNTFSDTIPIKVMILVTRFAAFLVYDLKSNNSLFI